VRWPSSGFGSTTRGGVKFKQEVTGSLSNGIPN
jgi:hypothetical protein